MFARINNFKKNGEVLVHVNRRFEYFHHYWHLLTYNFKDNEYYNFSPNYLFFEDTRFESHRSLFKKINLQLQNDEWSFVKNNSLLFLTHPAFRSDNIVIRSKDNLVNKVTSLFPLIRTLTKNNCNNNITRGPIIQDFKKLENQLFHRYPYEKRLVKLLSNIMTNNKPITQKDKEDIRFLVNAFIVELFDYGYKEKFIARVPDIILLRSNLDDPLFDKKRSDFNERKDYDEYVQQEMKSMTSTTIIEGLERLLNISKNKGYAIFKVDGINITKQYNIFDVEFYNPSLNTKVQASSEMFKNLEFFQEKNDKGINSLCNAICKVEFILPEDKMGNQIVANVHKKAKAAASVLSNILNKYSDKTLGNHDASPRIDKFFLVHEDFSPASVSYKRANFFSKTQFLSETYEDYAEKELEFYNIPTYNSKLGHSLIDLIHQQKELENKPENFSFKNLWIAWEGLAKKERIKSLAKASFRIFLNGAFIPKTKFLLQNNLHNWNSLFSLNDYYLLNEQQIESIGLKIDPLSKITAKGFQKRYKDILNYIDCEMLNDVLCAIDLFKLQKAQYFVKVDDWISRTIDEVYLERNLEVHDNIETEFSKFKLKGDFIAISNITINQIINNYNSRNKDDIQKLQQKIEEKAARI